MARVLIVGCGCRGRALASGLVGAGHVVRGTTRAESSLAAIESTGAEAAQADPDRLATLLPQIEGVSAVCWLMGSARSPALHGARLQSLIDKLVDTPVRGMVYEAAGEAGPVLLQRGAAMVRAASETYRMPVEIVEVEPSVAPDAWLAAMRDALGRIL